MPLKPAPPHQQIKSRRRWRWLSRWLVFAAALVLAWPWREASGSSVLLPALSPFQAIHSAVALRTAGFLTLLALPVLLLVLIIPRWFCHQACPTGLLQELVERRRSPSQKPWLRWPMVGRWLVLWTLGGACLGYPVFLWLDPLAIFNGFLNAWRQPLALASLLAGLGLPILLLLDVFLPRLWCQRLCPLGATQDLLSLPRRRLRKASRCSADPETQSQPEISPALARRYFLTACAGAAGAFVVRTVRAQSPESLRPPGSVAELSFLGVCVRCGNCAQICPSHIIHPDLGRSGGAGLFTPVLRFKEDYCREDCHSCNQVCPSGAITRLSLAEKRTRIIGQAQVDLDTCLLALGRECTACIQRCPYKAITLHSSDGGFSTKPQVDLATCNGCGACEAICPVRPVRSIRVISAPRHPNQSRWRPVPGSNE